MAELKTPVKVCGSPTKLSPNFRKGSKRLPTSSIVSTQLETDWIRHH
jgi:hypothetical protein